jgi:hypothetical protein
MAARDVQVDCAADCTHEDQTYGQLPATERERFVQLDALRNDRPCGLVEGRSKTELAQFNIVSILAALSQNTSRQSRSSSEWNAASDGG